MLQLHHGRRGRGYLHLSLICIPSELRRTASTYCGFFFLPRVFFFLLRLLLCFCFFLHMDPLKKDGNMHQLCPTTAQGWTIKSLCKFILLRMFQSITLLMQHIGLGWVLWLDKRIPQNINMLFSYCRMSRCVECLSLVPSCMTLS